MEVIETTKGGRKILMEGFCYVKQKNLSNGKDCFECEHRRNAYQCKAKIHVRGDHLLHRNNNHTHAADIAKNEMCKVQAVMRKRAENTEEPPQQIIAQAVRNIDDMTSAKLGAVCNLRRAIRRNRQKSGNPVPVPLNAADVDIPISYQMTDRDGLFLRYDNGHGQENRILIFASDHGINYLRDNKHWAGDGTFQTVPQIFFQLYTLQGISADNRVFPAVYALATNKRQDTYEQIFIEVQNLAGHPDDVIIDFERATVNALEATFPNVEVKGCLFHLAQNVYRQVQSHGLTEEYQRNGQFALEIRMILALAFVPTEDVITTFELLDDELSDEVQPILQYFEGTYIGRLRADGTRRNPMFSLTMWNVYERTLNELPRTNNHIEGWHRRFQADVGGHHANFWHFLDVIKREESLTRVQMVQAEAGENQPVQRRMYRDMQQRIRNIVDDYRNRNRIAYLRAIAHNFQF